VRFFFLDAAPNNFEGNWTPPRELQQHLKALRFGPDDEFLLVLPDGSALLARQASRTELVLLGWTQLPQLDLMPITLATAWPKGKRAEDLVVRACEAGVDCIQPVVFERSISGREALSSKQMERLRRVAREVCQQVGRSRIPEIRPEPIGFSVARDAAPKAQAICLRPGSRPLQLQLTGAPTQGVLLLVGPEGGTSPKEEAALAEQQWAFAALLPTILRIEAAGPLGAALCQAWYRQRES
jgi:16S rRNA (uracil1498-N3)-methyltransferase